MQNNELNGEQLLRGLSELTGLPYDLIEKELFALVAKTGKSPDEIGLDELREILATYVQDILLSAKRSLTEF
jgi:hypothetical protein